MAKKIITSMALMLAAAISNAQTTAVNWTASDCNGNSHTLYNELDSGKIIVFDWVMPCGSCVSPSKTAYDAVQGFATSHPGKVRFYMADDLGDATCSTLTSWITSNSIGSVTNVTVFSNAGNVINENDFGGTGMPHIIVMGGAAHKIYFNKKGSAANDLAGINSAVNIAIGAMNIASLSDHTPFTVSPNPVTGSFSVSHKKAIKKVTMISVTGQAIMEQEYPGTMNPAVDMSQYANGIYIVKITDADDGTSIQKVVKQ